MSDTVVVMNEGTIQQIGTPIDVYNEPENRFVARFIGESNIIEAVMIRDYLVAFDDFEFICVDKGFPENEPVDVVIRPEDIDIVKPEDANLTGTVKSVIFKGVHYEIVVTSKYRDYLIHTTDFFEVGLEVGLDFTPDDIHVMWQMGIY
jgi:spermidine/putrescine transport system ATP-binding protein